MKTKRKEDLEDIPMAYLWYAVLAIIAIVAIAVAVIMYLGNFHDHGHDQTQSTSAVMSICSVALLLQRHNVLESVSYVERGKGRWSEEERR